MYLPNLKSVALPVNEIIAIGILRVGCEPPISEKEGVWNGTVRKSVGDFLQALHIVTFPLSLRISEIFRFCTSARHFSPPTSSLPQNFPMFPWK